MEKSFYEASENAREKFIEESKLNSKDIEAFRVLTNYYDRSDEAHKEDYKYYDSLKIKTKEELFEIKIIKIMYNYFNNFHKKLFDAFLDLLPKISKIGYYSFIRSYKTTDAYNDIFYIFSKMEELLTYQYLDFDIIEYLDGKKYFSSYDFGVKPVYYATLLSVPEGKNLTDKIAKMIYESESITHFSYELVKGMIQSDNEEVKKMLFDLLKAAKLSEGLRSTIIENIDLGTIETYKSFLKYIRDENLIRFSSVKRSFLTFTGLEYYVSDKAITLLGKYTFECLLDNKIDEYLNSDNALKIYMGLYSLACYEFQDAKIYIEENFQNMKDYQKAVAILFLNYSKLSVNSKLLTNTMNSIKNEKLFASLIDNLPEIVFDNKIDKYNFVKAYLKNLNKIKKKIKYSILDQEINSTLNSSNSYSIVLKLVNEIDDLYELAYKNFDKHFYSYHKDKIFDKIKHPIMREVLIKSIGSGKGSIRDFAIETIENLNIKPTKEEYLLISSFLKSKRSDTRKYVSKILQSADAETILECANFLLNDKNKERKKGAISILVDNFDKIKDKKYFKNILLIIEKIEFEEDIAHSVNILLGKNKIKQEIKFFDQNTKLKIPRLEINKKFVKIFLNKKEKIYKNLEKTINKFYNIFLSHKGEDVEFTRYDNSKEIKKAGFDFNNIVVRHYMVSDKTYQKYTFYEDYIKIIDDFSNQDLVILSFIKKLMDDYTSHWNEKDEIIDYLIENKYLPDLKKLFKKYDDEKYDNILTNFSIVINLFIEYKKEEEKINIYEKSNELLLNITAYMIKLENERLNNKKESVFIDDNNIFNEFSMFYFYAFDTKKYFDNDFAYMVLANLFDFYKNSIIPLNNGILYRFFDLGYLSKDFIYSLAFNTKNINSKYSYSKYSYSKKILKECSDNLKRNEASEFEKEIYFNSINYMLEIELNRTEQDTNYSDIINSCYVFIGSEIFINAISKMGNIPFLRGYSWGSGGRKEIFSHIIANTSLEDNISQEKFNKLVKKYKLDKKKLLEASLYNLKFIEYTQNYLKINGLVKAAYYFKAHMNDYFDDYNKKIIARYTDISPEDLGNGQMDINWFKESYKELGKKNFELLYDCAKYITDGGNHKRAQYFADAVLGKLKLKYVEDRINDKRNQDMVLVYGLIPLRGNKINAALKRYKRLQKFLKESKQFGAQRQASESLKVSIALNNLARNYGLNDSNRFTWIMESKLIEKISNVFEAKKIDDIEVHISLKVPNKPEIIVFKKGKKLKSIPAKYNKNSYIKELKNIKKELKEQYRRTRNSLENSMINENYFPIQELINIYNHPVIRAIVKDLLFISKDNKIGFLKDNILVDYNNNTFTLKDDDELRLVHPSDLINNNWSNWQNYIIENKIKQAFKQVFRELYVMTDEEKENDGYTNRFAGYQIESTKMLGIMKSRGWIVNEYDGFEKINHKSNLRIDLYCYADWLTPSSIEQPSLEKIVFLDNKTNKTINMKELSPILYSETMRDIDLVVSVAYVGGVDPMMNHSTLEMRKRILEYNLKMFKIENYKLTEKHIIIYGEFANYSIHIGSSIIHVEDRGMLPIFPVHSQHRGHIFLPFVDEDPKTSEIISKVLMLAKDKDIKDPSILIHLK